MNKTILIQEDENKRYSIPVEVEVPAEDGTYTFNANVSDGQVTWEVAESGGGGSQGLMITASKSDDFTTVLDKTFQEIYDHIRSGGTAYIIYDAIVHDDVDESKTTTCHYVYPVTAITREDVHSDEEDFTMCRVEITWHTATTMYIPEYFQCESPTDYPQFNTD